MGVPVNLIDYLIFNHVSINMFSSITAVDYFNQSNNHIYMGISWAFDQKSITLIKMTFFLWLSSNMLCCVKACWCLLFISAHSHVASPLMRKQHGDWHCGREVNSDISAKRESICSVSRQTTFQLAPSNFLCISACVPWENLPHTINEYRINQSEV